MSIPPPESPLPIQPRASICQSYRKLLETNGVSEPHETKTSVFLLILVGLLAAVLFVDISEGNETRVLIGSFTWGGELIAQT
jgi:hypothetical protein